MRSRHCCNAKRSAQHRCLVMFFLLLRSKGISAVFCRLVKGSAHAERMTDVAGFRMHTQRSRMSASSHAAPIYLQICRGFCTLEQLPRNVCTAVKLARRSLRVQAGNRFHLSWKGDISISSAEHQQRAGMKVRPPDRTLEMHAGASRPRAFASLHVQNGAHHALAYACPSEAA